VPTSLLEEFAADQYRRLRKRFKSLFDLSLVHHHSVELQLHLSLQARRIGIASIQSNLQNAFYGSWAQCGSIVNEAFTSLGAFAPMPGNELGADLGGDIISAMVLIDETQLPLTSTDETFNVAAPYIQRQLAEHPRIKATRCCLKKMIILLSELDMCCLLIAVNREVAIARLYAS